MMYLMAFLLTSAITMGAFTNVKVNDCKTTRSVHSFVDTATIKIPASGRLKVAGKPQTNTIQTAQQFTVGDKVLINLGYNGELQKEFDGFIRRINFTTPVEIECEGYSWQLRKKTFQKTFASVTLRELLKFITTGTDIVLSDAIADTNLGKMILAGTHGGPVNGTEVLDWMKDKLGLTVYFDFNTIYAGLEEFKKSTVVKYRMGWNTARDNELKWHTADDISAKVIVISGKKSGNYLTATAGDDGGAVTQYNLPEGLSQEYIQSYAEAALKRVKFSGYQGRITSLLQPFAQPGDEAQIEDKRYTERGGNYFIESIEVNYGVQGARRLIGIGSSLTA